MKDQAPVLSADLRVLPTGLVTHTGKLVANPIFGEARKSLCRNKQVPFVLSSLKCLLSASLLHPSIDKNPSEFGKHCKELLKCKLFVPECWVSLRSQGVVGRTCCPLASWGQELQPWLVPGHPLACSKQNRLQGSHQGWFHEHALFKLVCHHLESLNNYRTRSPVF